MSRDQHPGSEVNNPPPDVQCPHCGYDLRAIPEERCPECGFRYDREGIIALSREWYSERLHELRLAAAVQSVGFLITLLFGVLGVHEAFDAMGGIPCVFVVLFLFGLWLVQAFREGVLLARLSELRVWILGSLVLVPLIWMVAACGSPGDGVWGVFLVPGSILATVAARRARERIQTLSLSTPHRVQHLRRWIAIDITGVVVSLSLGIILFLM